MGPSNTRAKTAQKSFQKWHLCKDRTPSSLMVTASTCGTTTWTWADSWRSCATGRGWTAETPRGPRNKRGAKSQPPGRRASVTPQRPARSAARRTPAATGHPQSTVAFANRTGNPPECTGHTLWNQRTGRWFAPFCGTIPAQCVRPRGIELTRAGTARSCSARMRRGCCQAPTSGSSWWTVRDCI